MANNKFDGRITKLEQQFIDRTITQALALAREVPRARFALVLMDALPHDGRGQVWCDLDLLHDTELELLAAWRP